MRWYSRFTGFKKLFLIVCTKTCWKTVVFLKVFIVLKGDKNINPSPLFLAGQIQNLASQSNFENKFTWLFFGSWPLHWHKLNTKKKRILQQQSRRITYRLLHRVHRLLRHDLGIIRAFQIIWWVVKMKGNFFYQQHKITKSVMEAFFRAKIEAIMRSVLLFYWSK